MPAKRLDNAKVKMGKFLKVANQKPARTAAEVYYAIKLQKPNGAELWCLFTLGELGRLNKFSVPDMENAKLGHLKMAHCAVGQTMNYFVKLELPDDKGGVEIVTRLSDFSIGRALNRADANKEDIPSMNWFQDLKD